MIEHSEIPSFTNKISNAETWNNNWNSPIMNIVGKNDGK